MTPEQARKLAVNLMDYPSYTDMRLAAAALREFAEMVEALQGPRYRDLIEWAYVYDGDISGAVEDWIADVLAGKGKDIIP